MRVMPVRPDARRDALAGRPVDPDMPPPPARSGHLQLDLLAAVAAGGAVGASARYGVELLLPSSPGGFPWGTFLVNVSGCFVIGALIVLITERLEEGTRLSRYLRPLLAVGLLGAYTTYSTYAVEVDTAIRDGDIRVAAGYAVASLVAGLGATYAGMAAASRLPPWRFRDRAGAGAPAGAPGRQGR